MSDQFRDLERIAPKLNRLHEDPAARVNYELMSDGLVWSDELPPWEELEANESHCLRAVWRFRSSLIMGAPDEKYRPSWEQAQKLFPNWPGFLPPRRLDTWRKTFLEQQSKLLADMDALDQRMTQMKCQEVS